MTPTMPQQHDAPILRQPSSHPTPNPLHLPFHIHIILQHQCALTSILEHLLDHPRLSPPSRDDPLVQLPHFLPLQRIVKGEGDVELGIGGSKGVVLPARVQSFEVSDPIAAFVRAVGGERREGEVTGRGGRAEVESWGEPVCSDGEAADGGGCGMSCPGLFEVAGVSRASRATRKRSPKRTMTSLLSFLLSPTRSAIHLMNPSPLSAASTNVISTPNALASLLISSLRSSLLGKLKT